MARVGAARAALVVREATLDNSTSARDNAQANLQQAQVNTKIAAVNYGYTKVAAPFDGIVSAHLVSIGELVGAASPTQLANRVSAEDVVRSSRITGILAVCASLRTSSQPSLTIGAMTTHDMARGEAQRDFGDGIGATSRDPFGVGGVGDRRDVIQAETLRHLLAAHKVMIVADADGDDRHLVGPGPQGV